jgi:hypothetical protein
MFLFLCPNYMGKLRHNTTDLPASQGASTMLTANTAWKSSGLGVVIRAENVKT